VSFVYQGYEYEYADFPVKGGGSSTRDSARAVEIPIALEFAVGHSVLEVGNVLNYYQRDYLNEHCNGFRCIDKYEGPIQEDILQYKPGCKFERIVSVSTLEHFGEKNGPKHKPLLGWKNMRLLLDGEMLVTIPARWNEWIDTHLDDFEFSQLHAMRKDGMEWEECDAKEVDSLPEGRMETQILLLGYA